MLEILENFDLTNYHGFRVPAKARYYVKISRKEDLFELENMNEFKEIKKHYLGQGYNTFFKQDFHGLIIHIDIKGFEKLEETSDYITFKLGAGEDWHHFVETTVNLNLTGIENLALIPSSIGSAVIQNIAAYGMEQSSTFIECEVFNSETKEFSILTKDSCKFSYRSSIFKTDYKDTHIVTSATYNLTKVKENYSAEIQYHSRYETLQQYLDLFAKPPYTVRDIFHAVIAIRNDKLPSVKEFGTVGSVFLNPFISVEKLLEIEKNFPGIQYYPTNGMRYTKTSDINLNEVKEVKLAIGWILEELGWAGKWINNVGTYVKNNKKNALLVITQKGATADDVYHYIRAMQEDLKERVGIDVMPEVVIV